MIKFILKRSQTGTPIFAFLNFKSSVRGVLYTTALISVVSDC